MTKTTYFSYYGKINSAGVRDLANLMSAAVADGTENLYLTIASAGGSTEVGFAAHNFIKSLPVPVTTHAIGYVDSAAVSLLLAGATRIASPISSLMIHRPVQDLPHTAEFTAFHLGLLSRQLAYHDQIIAQMLKDHSSMKEVEIHTTLDQGKRFSPQEALDAGLVHEIGMFLHPSDQAVHAVGG